MILRTLIGTRRVGGDGVGKRRARPRPPVPGGRHGQLLGRDPVGGRDDAPVDHDRGRKERPGPPQHVGRHGLRPERRRVAGPAVVGLRPVLQRPVDGRSRRPVPGPFVPVGLRRRRPEGLDHEPERPVLLQAGSHGGPVHGRPGAAGVLRVRPRHHQGDRPALGPRRRSAGLAPGGQPLLHGVRRREQRREHGPAGPDHRPLGRGFLVGPDGTADQPGGGQSPVSIGPGTTRWAWCGTSSASTGTPAT